MPEYADLAALQRFLSLEQQRAAGTTVLAIPNLAATRPVAHRSFSTLADPD